VPNRLDQEAGVAVVDAGDGVAEARVRSEKGLRWGGRPSGSPLPHDKP
jgi:hypothetical protein